MAASDYVPLFFKKRLHLAGRPQMSTRPSVMGPMRSSPPLYRHPRPTLDPGHRWLRERLAAIASKLHLRGPP
jgi:hypothetical protein